MTLTEDPYLNANTIPKCKKEPFHLEVWCIESLKDANLQKADGSPVLKKDIV